MPFSSFLPVKSDLNHYKRLAETTVAYDDNAGNGSAAKSEGDREFLIGKPHDEQPLSAHCRTPQRFRAFPSPRRLSREPQQGNMTLLIRRMDDTTFVLVVPKKATLSDLKGAIRDKFQEDGCQISWPHVWRHFCLRFKEQKLLEEHVVLYKLGVRDLDELVFMRHFDVEPHKTSFFSSFRRKHK
ncbi:hypothetical protein KP509_01G125400 [Ceratopteris richardii]|uniref:SNRNP25 ubiquitin-like domain-containing protein n=1 Tax=Ceratopteris richardii TaxID=49495 RepID=A0A8T2VP22_CERRI|nr:hypothetical protein KP509_01G125400 [Ceratopteris richardii]